MHGRSAFFHRFFNLGDEGKFFVLNGYRLECIPGAMRGIRGDSGNLIPFVPAVRIEQLAHRALVAEEPGEIGGRTLVRQYRPHAGHVLCFTQVHPPDIRVRVRTPEDSRMEHTRKGDILRVDGGAAHSLVRVNPWSPCANDLCLSPWLQSGSCGLPIGGFVVWHCRVVEGHSPSPCTVSSLHTGETTVHGSVRNLQLRNMQNRNTRVGGAQI